MSDELDDLKRAMEAATPLPDAVKKASNLTMAEENFARIQGIGSGLRHTSERGQLTRIFDGVKQMLNVMTTRGGLTATTAMVAVGAFVVLPGGRDLLMPPGDFDLGARVEQPEIVAPVENTVVDEIAVGGEAQLQGTESRQFGDDVLAVTEAPRDLTRRDRAEADAMMSELALEEPMMEMADAASPVAPLGQVASKSVAREQFQAAPTATMEAEALIIRPDERVVIVEGDTEAFANEEVSPLKITGDEPVSTFSIDVDTASYAVVRSSLMAGALPPEQAVRVEEMVNYFPYDYAAPDGAHPFRPAVTVMPTPWNSGTELVHIGIQGTMPAVEDRPPLNLVFLIDTSGSMQDANKLPLLKQSFRLMLSELRPDDEVSIVTYAGSAGQVLEPTRAAERSVILAALERLSAGGSTAGQAGIEQAYAVAEGMAGEGEVTRVVLATDGDFNVGISDPEALKDVIAKKRESGTYLSVLGFGRGNLDDATMQALAQNGNGQAAYIDTLSEARKVLVDQLTGALFPIANDVKIQVEFNPAEIAEYRLIGYETRALAREDFNNDRVDAGDIGAGHSVTAIYEVTPVGSDAVRNGPLRYGDDTAFSGDSTGELGFFKLRYKSPGESTSVLLEEPIFAEQGTAGSDIQFSVAMAGFGQLLRGGEYLGGWSWGEAIALASGSRGEDAFGYRAEAVTLMRLAETLAK
ncbi:MAG: DUF3520 domain-containing protein [Boseongicola sp.]|nr:MAG: DUF3520 domain-containing protein [Boseongicola sp.]